MPINFAQFATRDHAPKREHAGVKSGVVAERKNGATGPGCFQNLRALTRVQCERLFTDAMFSRAQNRQRHLAVKPIGCGDMHHVHVR